MAYLGAAQDRHEKDIHAFHTPHVACRRAVQTASVVVVFPGQLQEYCKEHSLQLLEAPDFVEVERRWTGGTGRSATGSSLPRATRRSARPRLSGGRGRVLAEGPGGEGTPADRR